MQNKVNNNNKHLKHRENIYLETTYVLIKPTQIGFPKKNKK